MLMLFAGYAVVFILLIGYVAAVARRLGRLESELRRLDSREDGGKTH